MAVGRAERLREVPGVPWPWFSPRAGEEHGKHTYHGLPMQSRLRPTWASMMAETLSLIAECFGDRASGEMYQPQTRLSVDHWTMDPLYYHFQTTYFPILSVTEFFRYG